MLPFLEVKGCSKSYPGVVAINNLDFDLFKGEIHCVIGENGAGKSTFIKILSGAIKPDQGIISYSGQNYHYLTPSQAQKLGIRTIYQEISLVPELSVAENIFIGNEPVNQIGIINFRELKDKARSLLNDLKIDLDVNTIVRDLGTAQKQSIQIAKAMAEAAKIFILDEPTASFSSSEISNLLSLILNISETGVGIIYISHHLDEVFQIHSRISVLRDGIKVAVHGKNEVSENTIINEMIGRDVKKHYLKGKSNIEKEKFIEFRDFSNGKTIKHLTFRLSKGEIVGFAGMVGSGRTELARMIFGVDRKESGDLIFEGNNLNIQNPQQAIKAGFGFLTEDRKITGLILEHSVLWNISIVELCKKAGLLVNEATERKDIESLIKKLVIKTPNIHQIAQFLSGGNQQKVVLAKWLYSKANFYIFDEPTHGIDIGAKEEIYKYMVDLAREGKYILMISSDMPELIAMCDRVVIMKKGSIVADLTGKDICEEKILTYSIGGTI